MIERTELGSGLRVITESLPQLRSVTLGAWVGTGARDEVDEVAGASHFLEHLLFKGTETRSARDIADTIESVGGEMNAFTSHEHTVFYVRVPDSQLELAADVLSDIVWRPAFRPDEVETERQVILEEIAMRDDTPDDLVHDVFASTLFPEHQLGREVIGFEETVSSMTRDSVRGYHGSHYHAANTVFAAAGNLEHATVRDLADRFGPSTNGARPARELAPFTRPLPVRVVERDTEQAHLVLGVRASAHRDPDRYALTVLNHVLGGGMSSRLFQEIRESRGLAYSVYSFRAAFDDSGYLAIYAGTTVDRAKETLALIHGEIDGIVRDGTITDDELRAAKGNLTGSLLMSLETSSSRMRRLGHGELVEGEIPTLEELARRVEEVTLDDVGRVVDRLFRDEPRALAVVGPFSESDF
ncbi:MAG TPA: pitrilysin family protein [Acidimicrobiia bacterium]